MKKVLKRIILLLDDTIFRMIVKFIYPQYRRQRYGYNYNYKILLSYAISQKIFRINANIPWPVDFRSKILGWEYIKKGIMCDPGDNIGVYINAHGGILLGNNVAIGANCILVSSNHDIYDHRNVWIGANSVILPGVEIGNNVTIGAGSIISENISTNSIILSYNRKYDIIEKKDYDWDCTMEELI